MDEAGTLLTEHRPLPVVITFAARDVHPPLFYFLLFCWQRIPLGLDWAVQARALAVVFGLLATVALDRLWASQLPPQLRLWFFLLWCLSPGLLLYERMSRSYSLQVLLVVIAAAYLLRLAELPRLRDGVIFVLATLALLYSHYAPGMAMLVALHLLLALRRRWKALVAVDLAILVGYAPWLLRLVTSLGSWGSHSGGYAITGRLWLEIPLKLGYWAVSFSMGEAVPDVLLVCGLLVLAGAVWLLLAGARYRHDVAALAGILAITGFIGVARWVSYPFVPARLLFVLPFFLFLGVAGAEVYPRVGRIVLPALLVLAVSGTTSYFLKANFRNKQYPMPMSEIAGHIRQSSSAADSAILVDSANSDPTALEYALGPGRPFLLTTADTTDAALNARLADRHLRVVWFLRNTHDVSPDARNTHFEAMLRQHMGVTTYYYQPYSLLERGLLRTTGIPNPPWYFHELLEFRR
jgi:hypothetical protein